MIQRADITPRRPAAGSGGAAGPWLLMFAVAFVLRAAYAWLASGPGATPYSDPAEYDAVAWNLARGAGFSLGIGSGAYPTAFVPPLLPWLVSLVYRVAGHQYFAALLFQCFIGALAPVMLASLGAAVFGGNVGRIAGWLAVVHPLLIFFCGYLLTETLFCLVLVTALLASVEWIKTPRPGRAFGVGLLWGLATLARPPALLLPLVVLGWAWAPLGLTVATRDRIRQCALLLLGVALVVGPWTLRNAAVMHAFVPVTTGGGRALLDSNNPIVWGDPALRGGADSRYALETLSGEFRGRSEPEADALARAHALDFLRAHSAEWPAMALAKLGRFWRLGAEIGANGGWQRSGSPLAAIARRIDPLLLWSLVILPLALWGGVRTLRGPRRWFQSLALLTILYFTLGSVVFWGSLRLRLPIEPLVVLLAAAGFEDLRRRARTSASGLRVIEGRRKAS